MDSAALENEILALRARLAILEDEGSTNSNIATLATLNGTPRRHPSPADSIQIVPTPSATVRFYTLVGADKLPKDEREFRRVPRGGSVVLRRTSPHGRPTRLDSPNA